MSGLGLEIGLESFSRLSMPSRGMSGRRLRGKCPMPEMILFHVSFRSTDSQLLCLVSQSLTLDPGSVINDAISCLVWTAFAPLLSPANAVWYCFQSRLSVCLSVVLQLLKDVSLW